MDNIITYRIDSRELQSLCTSDPKLAFLIRHFGDLTYYLHKDMFSFFVETIVGQMLSSKAAEAIKGRLYNLCGGEISVSGVLELDGNALKEIGLSKFKSDYISNLAKIAESTPNFFSRLMSLSDNDAILSLTMIRGIGPWSAKMCLIFALGRLNILPYEDSAFMQAYKWLYDTNDSNPASIQKTCAIWSPYASLASRYLYKALDEGLTKDANITAKLRDNN